MLDLVSTFFGMAASISKSFSKEDEPTLTTHLKNRNSDLKPFLHPFHEGQYGIGSEPKTLLECTMVNLSGTIRAKPKWYEKMKDETIRNKWKQEALGQNLLTEKQIDYVLAELEYYNAIRDGSMEMSSIDGVWQSDELIPIHMKQSLIEHVNKLENIPESEKDWHPGTNQQILDLVHPSLFCYVYNESRVIDYNNQVINLHDALEHIGDGKVIHNNSTTSSSRTKRPKKSSNYARSDKYQWLPTEFNVSNDGQVKIESYINNLHPVEHKELYGIIEQIFERFVPLFNKVLTDLIEYENKPNRVAADPFSWYDNSNSRDESEDEDNDDYYDTRPIKMPDVKEFRMPLLATPNIDLRGRKLQVIVKLANIILTPDNPQYPGGVWHVEGMENEHIVSTGIFYYSNSNITESNLQFRTAIREPDYEQNDDRGVRLVYGLNDEGPLNQGLGEIITQEDRCIAFPNIYQHRVAPFQLKDSSQPGFRKILVFFLIDPAVSILSTTHVPPQQSHWLTEIVRSMPRFEQLPLIVVDKIMNYVDYPMTMTQAKQHREKLMEERKYFISQNNELLFERPFSLCEH